MRRLFLATFSAILVLMFGVDSAKADFPPAPGEVVTIHDFVQDPETGYFEMPELVTTSFGGRIYVTDFGRSTIWLLDSAGNKTEHAVLPSHAEMQCGLAGPSGTWINVLTEDIYVNVNSCVPDDHGLWKVYPDGSLEQVAVFPQMEGPTPLLMNGLVKLGSYFYIVNSMSLEGNLYRVHKNEIAGTPEIFVTDELLSWDTTVVPPPYASMIPGGNGLQKYGNSLLYANSGRDIIAEIPVELNWVWGEGLVEVPGDVSVYTYVHGPDDFAVDIFGCIYTTNDIWNQLLYSCKGWEIDDAIELMNEDDGLDGSTAAAFGHFPYNNILFVTSGSFGPLGMLNARGTPKIQALGTLTIGYPRR